MQKYKNLKFIILDIISDGMCHTTDEIVQECGKRGISFEEGRRPIYNAVFQLNKSGKIEKIGKGCFMCKKEENTNEKVRGENINMMDGIRMIKEEIEKYKKFNWINCSDDELKQARVDVKELKKLSEDIQELVCR